MCHRKIGMLGRSVVGFFCRGGQLQFRAGGIGMVLNDSGMAAALSFNVSVSVDVAEAKVTYEGVSIGIS
ncbi:hypothetical protein QYF36_010599 [Acer negundo]|nr:hypothetical protein QYF36_010599 [Acer negundo]